MAVPAQRVKAEKRLLDQYKESLKGGDPDLDARNALIEMYLPLIRWQARAIYTANLLHCEFNELVNAGCVGMIEGLRRFDRFKGHKVSTYCLWWIRNEMHKHVSSDGKATFPRSTTGT